MKKIAFCLSGLTRSLWYTWPIMREYLITPANGDVFLHTWDIHHAGSRLDHGDKASSTLDFTHEEYIKSFIKPINYTIENYEEFAQQYGHSSTPAMYYSIMESNELARASKNKYDIVFRIRMDCFFDTLLPSDLSIPKNTIMVSCNCAPEKYIHNLTTDIFAFSEQTTMDIYANAFNFWLDNKHLQSEQVLHNWLNQNNITTSWTNIKMKVLDHWSKNKISAHALYE